MHYDSIFPRDLDFSFFFFAFDSRGGRSTECKLCHANEAQHDVIAVN